MHERVYDLRVPQGAENPPVPGGTGVLSVSELTSRIKHVLESEFPAGWVRGEVSNLRMQASGHSYFSMKDAGAQIACVMFRGDAARSGTGGLLRDGAQILVYGSLSVYEPRGSYQLVVRMVVDDGAGRLQLEFERLKQRLAAEGLFDAGRKRALPAVPGVIGFITSPTGAAIQDFIRILKRRRWVGRLVVVPVKVQGTGAAAEMMAALELAAKLERVTDDGTSVPLFDLLVIGRGGGSLEDLWAFNEEPLVRAVAACSVPIVSAVGHEIDFTLCDFAADVRAETPSAAAELVTSGFLDYLERLRQAENGLDEEARNYLRSRRDRLRLFGAQLSASSPQVRLEKAWLQLDDVHNRLERSMRAQITARRESLAELRTRLASVSPAPRLARMRDRLSGLEERLRKDTARVLALRSQRLGQLRERLEALGPDSVLKRGFVIIRDLDGKPVTRRRALGVDARVVAQFHDGDVRLRTD